MRGIPPVRGWNTVVTCFDTVTEEEIPTGRVADRSTRMQVNSQASNVFLRSRRKSQLALRGRYIRAMDWRKSWNLLYTKVY